MVQVKGKVYVVTGGAQGLGKGAAEVLLSAGASVTIVDVNQPTPNGWDKYVDRLLFVQADVSRENEVQEAFAKTKNKFGKIDGLVHCAAICRQGDEIYNHELNKPGDLTIFQQIITVNLLGTLNVDRLIIPYFLDNQPDEEGQKGIIINTSSVSGHGALPSVISYSATKAAIISMTYPLAKQLGPLGIRVMDISPGICDTPMLLNTMETNKNVADLADLKNPFPSRLIKPHDFGKTVKETIENPMLNGFSQRLDGALRTY